MSSSLEVELERLLKSILDLNEEKALEITENLLTSNVDPLKILEVIKKAAEEIGGRFERGEYFVADLVMAGEILKGISEKVMPKLREVGRSRETVGKLLIGTVEGDIHDIGKNIVVTMAEAVGFEVVDLGVDVPPKKFVEAIKQHNPNIVGLSGLLTLAIDSMKKTVDAIRETGLREKVKIIIGGGRVDQYACEYVGADAWTNDAATGVRIMLKWVREKEGGG
ncbi:MAG: cobalamin-dependent protein [Candidatus Nezhaarchaeales archaeon]